MEPTQMPPGVAPEQAQSGSAPIWTLLGWRTHEIRAQPDPQLQQAFAGRNLADVRSIDTQYLSLRNLTQMDVLQLLALQSFMRASPA